MLGDWTHLDPCEAAVNEPLIYQVSNLSHNSNLVRKGSYRVGERTRLTSWLSRLDLLKM